MYDVTAKSRTDPHQDLRYLVVKRDEDVVGELRYAVGGAFDPQLFHSVSQRIRMHTKSLRGAVCALYHPASLLEHSGDMSPLNFFQGLNRRRWPSILRPFSRFGRCIA